MKDKLKVIISGGGTGGHIVPALSIADALRRKVAGIDILFVGAEGRMEMQRVPEAGYRIVGLPVMGFDRHSLFKNVKVLWRLLKSERMARRILRDFRPDIAIGVGGYASGPTLREAARMGVPTMIQEQNSYAGVTNRLLSKHVRKICVAYPGMEKYFDASKIVFTGNPVRESVISTAVSRAEALGRYGLSPDKPTVLIVGGSLGARTLNETVMANSRWMEESGYQFICQTGKAYYGRMLSHLGQMKSVVALDFIKDMGVCYRAADLVVSRAGAGAISELELLGKPAILVPSPNVAEDHQTKNAMALVERGAAVCVRDAEAQGQLMPAIAALLGDSRKLAQMSDNIRALACPDAASRIADEALKLVNR